MLLIQTNYYAFVWYVRKPMNLPFRSCKCSRKDLNFPSHLKASGKLVTDIINIQHLIMLHFSSLNH